MIWMRVVSPVFFRRENGECLASPFRAGVEAGAGAVISSYMDMNDVPAAGNVHLLQDVLRNQLHFQGFVVSDAFAVGSLVTRGFARFLSWPRRAQLLERGYEWLSGGTF